MNGAAAEGIPGCTRVADVLPRLRAIACVRLEAARELHALAPRGLEVLDSLDSLDGLGGLGGLDSLDGLDGLDDLDGLHESETHAEVGALLAALVDARERCVARLVADDAEWRTLAAAAVAAADPVQAALLHEIRESSRETGALLEAIAAADAAFLAALATHRGRVAASRDLARDLAREGRAVHRAYAPPATASGAAAPRFMDRRC